MVRFSEEDLVLQIASGSAAVVAANSGHRPHIAERILIAFGRLIGLKA